MNRHVKYLGQRSFHYRSYVQTHKHSGPTALPAPQSVQ